MVRQIRYTGEDKDVRITNDTPSALAIAKLAIVMAIIFVGIVKIYVHTHLVWLKSFQNVIAGALDQ